VDSTYGHAVPDDNEVPSPRGYDGAASHSSEAVAFNLAQDLPVQEHAELDTPLTTGEKRYCSDGFVVQRIGSGDLIAQKRCALTRRGRAEPLDRRASDVDAPVREVLIDVAQDVGSLHGSPECCHFRLAVLSREAEELGEHQPDRATGTLAIAFKILFSLDLGTRDVMSHCLAKLNDRARCEWGASAEVTEDTGLGATYRVTRRPALDRFQSLRCLWTILVYQIVKRAQDVVEAIYVRAHIGGEQPKPGAERARVRRRREVADLGGWMVGGCYR
jgi:hypothetical protein